MRQFSFGLVCSGLGLVICVALTMSLVACSEESEPTSTSPAKAPVSPKVDMTLNATNATMVLNVQGMMCEQNCVPKVTHALAALPAVQAVHVSLDDAKAYVKCDMSKCDLKTCIDSVTAAGFTASAFDPNAPMPEPAAN